MQVTSTPCLAICRIDPASGLCIGCGRTAREIGDWVVMTEPERLALMARLPDRFVAEPGLAAARAAFDDAMAARRRVGRRRRA
ncbi:DUF1289 domain-containing protein [Labrys wisconsinensis]|uniref:Fe-S protein YdhL (DUF1289 family) n=1 Tax=Labrys wisconsinensis TaxID=425677 RepID=A0ABU0JC75_9HYPH|nr:DUF1289 domain-containing protein [Labrys wisconsinensis]MDQ0471013.1 putative Fe-S protein YdhL (DUF1289 family) [Labrys wisconsinensis]